VDAGVSPDPLHADDRDEAAAGYVGLQDIIVVTVSGIQIRCWVRDAAGGMAMDVTAQDIRVRDLITAHSCHPWILLSRPLTPLEARFDGGGDWYMPASAPGEAPGAGECGVVEGRADFERGEREGTQVALKVEVRIQGGKAFMTRISLDVNPLEVTLVPESLKALGAYFVPVHTHTHTHTHTNTHTHARN
jgi:hypothetical protein